MLTITPICRKYQTKVFIMNYRFLSVVHFLLLLTVLLSRTVNVKNFKLLYLPGVATRVERHIYPRTIVSVN
jgi:hypothetical protein